MRARSQTRARTLAIAAAAVTFSARADWSVPQTGYEMLRAMQLERYDSSTRAGLDSYANAVAAHAMAVGIFRAGVLSGRFCIKESVLYADVALTVRAWLEQNTEALSEDAAALTDRALLKAFPCK